jgi:hypothetical protein
MHSGQKTGKSFPLVDKELFPTDPLEKLQKSPYPTFFSELSKTKRYSEQLSHYCLAKS